MQPALVAKCGSPDQSECEDATGELRPDEASGNYLEEVDHIAARTVRLEEAIDEAVRKTALRFAR